MYAVRAVFPISAIDGERVLVGACVGDTVGFDVGDAVKTVAVGTLIFPEICPVIASAKL